MEGGAQRRPGPRGARPSNTKRANRVSFRAWRSAPRDLTVVEAITQIRCRVLRSQRDDLATACLGGSRALERSLGALRQPRDDGANLYICASKERRREIFYERALMEGGAQRRP